MIIKIAEKLRPFTHQPGMKVPLPGSKWILQVFPTLIKVFDGKEVVQDWPLDVQGPVKDFTVQLDLVKGCVHVFGQAQNGSFRKTVYPGESGISFAPTEASKSVERLSLGSHKSQNWLGVTRRGDLKEILPVWFQLGQMISRIDQDSSGGTFSLLKPDVESLTRLWLAGFEGLMTPRIEDTDLQGFNLPPVDPSLSPLPLLSDGWKVIRSLFFKEETLAILPHVPKEFHCGRLIGLQTHNKLTINIEWSKKQLRRMEVMSQEDSALKLLFPKELKSYRIEKEKRISTDNFLELEKGKWYILDNFRK